MSAQQPQVRRRQSTLAGEARGELVHLSVRQAPLLASTRIVRASSIAMPWSAHATWSSSFIASKATRRVVSSRPSIVRSSSLIVGFSMTQRQRISPSSVRGLRQGTQEAYSLLAAK